MAQSTELQTLASPPPAVRRLTALVDVTLGAAVVAVGVGRSVASAATPVVRPLAGVALRPPLVPAAYQPATWLESVVRRGGDRREALQRDLADLLDLLVPLVAREVLSRMDLTDLVGRYVDLDALVSTVDLDRVAERLDVEAVVARLDLNRIVREHVDLDALVSTVDLDAVAARIDVAAVIDRVDLVGLAEGVIAEVDLPEIIRESTGSMASETVRGVRMQGISGDEALGRAMERLRLRRARHRPALGAPAERSDAVGSPEGDDAGDGP